MTFSSCVGGDHFSILTPYVMKMLGIKAFVVDFALETSLRDEIFYYAVKSIKQWEEQEIFAHCGINSMKKH